MTAPNPSPTRPVDQATAGRLNAISVVLVLGALTTLLDTTIVNIALDRLRRDFDATVADTQWVATAYLLAFVSVIPVSGWVSERVGARKAWLAAVALFMAGSVLCGAAWSLPALVTFRVLQGAGGGMVLPVTITILTRAAGKERIGRAIATIGLIGQLAPILGPVIGGALIKSASWHWLFFVNVPLCLLALTLGPVSCPPTRDNAAAASTYWDSCCSPRASQVSLMRSVSSAEPTASRRRELGCPCYWDPPSHSRSSCTRCASALVTRCTPGRARDGR